MNLRDFLRELDFTLRNAVTDYSIHCAYTDARTNGLYEIGRSYFYMFFAASSHAHLLSYSVVLYRLYENKPKAVNIPALLRKLKKESIVSDDILNKLEELQLQARPLWEKIRITRNKVFAHQEIQYDYNHYLEKADLQFNDISNLIDISRKILNTVYSALGEEPHQFLSSAGEETIKLLEFIKSHCQQSLPISELFLLERRFTSNQ